MRRGALALMAVVLAACGSDRPRPAPTPAASVIVTPKDPAAVGRACLRPAERANVVGLRSGSGVVLGGVLLGDGPAGVALVHESTTDLCQWMPFARLLARRGYRVAAFDLNGWGSSPASAGSPARPRWDLDAAAAVAALRERGARRVVIAGVTFGGLAALVAGSAVRPPVAGVIDLSSQAQTSGLDGLAAARRLSVPTLYVDSLDDEYTHELRELYAATRAHDKRLELIPGASHGLSLLDPEQEPRAGEVRALVLDWIRTRTG